MLNYINYVLKKTNLTDDIIILITNELYKKMEYIKNKN